MKSAVPRSAALLVGIALAAACAAQRPVLYPNERLVADGEELAEQHIDACLELAAAHGHEAEDPARKVGEDAAGGAAAGAVVGTAVGAVLGNPGRGAGAGAAAGGTRGGIRGLMRSGDPDPIQRQFVEQCLREQGYQPIGWR